MPKHPEVTQKARALFEKDFFGQLVIINGPNRGAAYLENDHDQGPLTFEARNVIERGDDWMVSSHELLGVTINTKWFCEDGRIYALVSRWEFREYFPPLQEQ